MSGKPIESQFFKFVFPSMLSMLLNGFYTMVDGFFIGQAVGDVGLAGIGLAWPIAAVLLALGVGIGTGGSVLISIRRGEKNEQKSGEAQFNTFLILVITSILTTAVFFFSYPVLLRWMGAEGEVLTAAEEYMRIVALGGSMQIFATGLTPILRNNHRTVQAMAIMCVGLVVNIVLDAWFLMGLEMGLGGAALATVIAQGTTVILCIISLICEKEHRLRLSHCRMDFRVIRRILIVGISPFGLSLMPSLISLFNNWQCLAYGGDNAVAAYCVINYFISTALLLMQGIGDGIQPLISFCRGGKLYSSMRILLRRGIIAVLGLSVLFILVSFPLQKFLPIMFGTSEATGDLIGRALLLQCAAFPFMGIVRLYTSYFYASGKTAESSILIYIDPILTTPVFLLLLPLAFRLDGVWLTLPAAQTVLALILLFMARKDAREYRRLFQDEVVSKDSEREPVYF